MRNKLIPKSCARLWLIVVFLLPQCGNDYSDVMSRITPNHRHHLYDGRGVEPEIKPFIADFPGYTGMPIVFVDSLARYEEDDSSRIVGMCYFWQDGFREIAIEREFWFSVSDRRKKALIWHELGHCSWNIRGHDDSVTEIAIKEDYAPKIPLHNSIMATHVWSDAMIRQSCEYNYNIDILTIHFCEDIEDLSDDPTPEEIIQTFLH